MKYITALFMVALLLFAGTANASTKLFVNPGTLDFSGTTVSPSPVQTYTLGWNDSHGNTTFVKITPSANVQISRDGITFKSYPDTLGVNVQHSAGGISNLTTIYTRIVLANPGTLTDSVVNLDTSASANRAVVKVVGYVPLPIQLASFKAVVLTGNGVTLTWITASETNNYGFYVQRDGVDIIFIAGLGTSTTGKTYTYTDNPDPGQHRYGLRQVDLNGAAHF